MARRITIVSGENLTGEEYADCGDGIWVVLKIAHPDGGLRIEATASPRCHTSTTGGRQCPWQ
jgi:hypothetical protein